MPSSAAECRRQIFFARLLAFGGEVTDNPGGESFEAGVRILVAHRALKRGRHARDSHGDLSFRHPVAGRGLDIGTAFFFGRQIPRVVTSALTVGGPAMI